MPTKHRVLVVDDNSDILEILDRKLSAFGYSVSCASTAVEALGYLAHGLEPAVILSDVQMPILSGVEFAQMLRQRKSAVPIILMSGEARLEQHEIASLNVHAFIPKPLDFDFIQSCLDTAVKIDADFAANA